MYFMKQFLKQCTLGTVPLYLLYFPHYNLHKLVCFYVCNEMRITIGVNYEEEERLSRVKLLGGTNDINCCQ